jgi:hypothetical protein
MTFPETVNEKCDFRFSLGTSLCLAALRRPAAVQIGYPADLSSFLNRLRDREMAVPPCTAGNSEVIQSFR